MVWASFFCFFAQISVYHPARHPGIILPSDEEITILFIILVSSCNHPGLDRARRFFLFASSWRHPGPSWLDSHRGSIILLSSWPCHCSSWPCVIILVPSCLRMTVFFSEKERNQSKLQKQIQIGHHPGRQDDGCSIILVLTDRSDLMGPLVSNSLFIF